MGFVKNFKDKLSEHFVANEYDEYDSAISDDDYEDNETSKGNIYDDIKQPEKDDYGYSAKSEFDVPEYNFGTKKTGKETKTPYQKAESTKSSSNIYNMNSVRPVNKFKLNSILLRDIYDAKNVASLMMDKDTIIVVNLSLLNEEQKIRAMDFLDGAKFVTKSVFARFAENICAFVPESVELFGDFFSQIDMDSFK